MDITFDEHGDIEVPDYDVITDIMKQMNRTWIETEAHNRAEAIRHCVLMELFSVAIEKMANAFGPKSLSVLELNNEGWVIYHEYHSNIAHRPFVKLRISINSQNIEF